MNTTPNCLYCGTTMKPDRTFMSMLPAGERPHFWYLCGECGSRSPAMRTQEAAKAAALQRYVEPANGCCWCIADGVINKVYIRTDDSDYTFVDAKFCPKCGRDLEESQ